MQIPLVNCTSTRSLVALTAVVLLALTSCKGSASLSDSDGTNGGPTETEETEETEETREVPETEAELPAQPLRRISSEQYRNILRDLFDEPIATDLIDRSIFPETTIDSGFAGAAAANVVNRSESNRIEDNAEALANRLLEQADETLPQIASCVEPGYSESDVDDCMPQFIEEFGQRTYRRPLTAEEAMIAQDVYDTIREEQGAEQGWASVMQLFLQAPALLYRVERGIPADDPEADLKALDDWEMAARLSFFFLNSMPDEELFAAAEAGELRTEEQIEAQARRLSQDPRVIDTLASFHRDWTKIYQLETADRSDGAFTPEVRAAMQAEIRSYVRYVYEERDGRLQTLLTSDEFPVAAELGPLYGIDDADGSVRTVPDRAGLFTQVGFTTAHAKEAATDPIHRGHFIFDGVLCGTVPEVPPGLDLNGPLENTAGEPTARERLAPLMERNDCSGCHTQFNPIGLSLESYDELGRYRTEENGAEIDPSGELILLGGDASYEDAREMVSLMASSDRVHDCYVDQWYEYAMGRSIVDGEAPVIDPLKERFRESDGDIRELLVAIATSVPFRYRPVAQTE